MAEWPDRLDHLILEGVLTVGRVRTIFRRLTGTADPAKAVEIQERPLLAWRDLEDDVVWVLSMSKSRTAGESLGLDLTSGLRRASVYRRIHRRERLTREGSLTATVKSLLRDAVPLSTENAEHFELRRRRVYDAVVGIRGGSLLPYGGEAWAEEANRVSRGLRIASLFAMWLAPATIVSFAVVLFSMCLDENFVPTEAWPRFIIVSMCVMAGLGLMAGSAFAALVRYDKQASQHLAQAESGMTAGRAGCGAAS